VVESGRRFRRNLVKMRCCPGPPIAQGPVFSRELGEVDVPLATSMARGLEESRDDYLLALKALRHLPPLLLGL
jgi:hypothetical protein